MSKRVVTFGTFDQIDEGHIALMDQVRACGDELIVIVARDEHVRTLKGKTPKQSEEERCNGVRTQFGIEQVVLSDKELGTYKVLEEINPDVIALGFDQTALKKDLERWMQENQHKIPLAVLEHVPEKTYAQNLD